MGCPCASSGRDVPLLASSRSGLRRSHHVLQDTEARETDTVAVWLPPALLTDKYELTMLAAALRDGSAHRRTTFEVFARRLPEGRRYGVVAGHGALRGSVGAVQIRRHRSGVTRRTFSTRETLAYLADYRFRGDVDGYAEGELYFPGSPCCRCTARSANAWCWRRWRCRSSTTTPRSPPPPHAWSARPKERPLIEMGSRRTHEQAAVAAARAAYIAGFTGVVEPRGPAPLRGACAGHQRACVHAAAHHRAAALTRTGARSRRRSTRSASAPPCSSTPTTSRREWPTPSRWQAPSSARSASTPAIWACWPARSASNSTRSAPTRPASWCRVISTSSRSRRCAPSPSTSTASAPRWSPARARRPPAWSTSWWRWTACRSRNAAATRNRTAAASRRCALAKPSGHHRRGGRPSASAGHRRDQPWPGTHGRPGARGRTGRRPRHRRGRGGA